MAPSRERLDVVLLVVVPDLVALDRPAPTPPTENLTALTGFGCDLAAQPVPHRQRRRGSRRGVRAGRRDEPAVRRASTPRSSSSPATKLGRGAHGATCHSDAR